MFRLVRVLSNIKDLVRTVRMESQKPVIVVIGYTGAGKSKLSIEIAKKYNGEIINADSMQLYKGLDLVTNKVTEEEKENIPHHLLGFVEPCKRFTVADFQSRGISIINSLHEQNKLPVIVGGTNYYVESLLYKILVKEGYYSNVGDGASINITDDLMKEYGTCDLEPHENCDRVLASDVLCKLKAPAEEDVDLYPLLKKVDPRQAACLHPKDGRKIRRALEIWLSTGTTMTDHRDKQREDSGSTDIGGEIRFPNSAMIWVGCDKEVLDERLDRRVDDMIEKGLVEEIQEFHESHNRKFITDGVSNHYEYGVYQSIGFKEFHEYLSVPEHLRKSKQGEKLFKDSVNLMKARTKKYAKTQLKWKRNRLVQRDRQNIPIYDVDTTDPSDWDEKVSKITDDVVSNLLQNQKPKLAKPSNAPSQDGTSISTKDLTHYECEICGSTLIGEKQYADHLAGSRHRRQVKRLSKLAARNQKASQEQDEEDDVNQNIRCQN